MERRNTSFLYAVGDETSYSKTPPSSHLPFDHSPTVNSPCSTVSPSPTPYSMIFSFVLHSLPPFILMFYRVSFSSSLTDKKENQVFLIYKEIQNGAVAKSFMTNGLLIFD
jgi:hypothetical protein